MRCVDLNIKPFLRTGFPPTNSNELLAQIDIQMDLAISDNSPLVGKTISDIEVRGKGAFIVIALRKLDDTMY